MPSAALESVLAAISEVDELQRANPTPTGASLVEPQLTRVVGRASVVLISSHFERYFYAVNEEAVIAVNAGCPKGPFVPERLRLTHSQDVVDRLSITSWDQRGEQLRKFVSGDGWLWSDDAAGNLEHDRLLRWMKAPTPDRIRRYYRQWAIPDIFGWITRTSHTRSDLIFRVTELVDKRNAIAHGDQEVEATQADVEAFLSAVRTFCPRADGILARRLSAQFGIPRPW